MRLWALGVVLLSVGAGAAEPDLASLLGIGTTLQSKHALTPADRALISTRDAPLFATIAKILQEHRDDLLKAVIAAGWDPAKETGWSPVTQAVQAQDIAGLRVLLAHHAPATVPSWSQGMATPLSEAVSLNSEAMARVLLNAGASPDEGLDAAAWVSSVPLTRLLLRRGARLPTKDLRYLIADRDVTEVLLPKLPTLDVTDEQGRTLLHLIASHDGLGPDCRQPKIVAVAKALLERGAKPDLVDSHAMTPLALAAQANCTGLVQLLLSRRVDVAHRGPSDATPLHLAAAEGAPDTARLLLLAGAPVDALDSAGATPLHRAAAGKRCWINHCVPINSGVDVTLSLPGHPEVVRLLLEHGADPLLKTKAGELPLTLAERAQGRVRALRDECPQPRGWLGDFRETMDVLSHAMARAERGPTSRSFLGRTPFGQ